MVTNLIASTDFCKESQRMSFMKTSFIMFSVESSNGNIKILKTLKDLEPEYDNKKETRVP